MTLTRVGGNPSPSVDGGQMATSIGGGWCYNSELMRSLKRGTYAALRKTRRACRNCWRRVQRSRDSLLYSRKKQVILL